LFECKLERTLIQEIERNLKSEMVWKFKGETGKRKGGEVDGD